MREELWWNVRNAGIVRRLSALPVLGALLRQVSHAILPSSVKKRLTVQRGIGKGLTLDLNPRWQHAIWQGTYEPSAQRVFAEFAKPGTVVYDVGGGVGFYSLAAARRGASVFTFEPDPHNFGVIERHALMNGLRDKVNLIPLAAFSRTGTLVMEPSETGHSPGHAFAREIW